MLCRRPVATARQRSLVLLALAAAGLVLGASQNAPASAAGSQAPGVGSLRIGSNDMANTGDVSSYAYVIMQASEWARIPALKAANPQLKVIAYEDMSLTPDWTCTNSVDDAFPASGLGFCATNTAHPDWFLTDNAGQRVPSVWYAGDWFMDIGNPAYQNAWAGAVVSVLRSKGFDGVMLDDANNDPTGPLGSRTLAKYPTPQSYAAATSGFLQNVCGQVRAAGFLALPNVQAGAPRAVRNQWAGYCSGTVKEYWTKWGTSTNLQKAGADWADEVAQLEDADAAGKILIPIVYGPMNDTRDMTFARATFLLGWNGSSPSALIWDTPSVAPWSPAWTASVGSPVGARRQVTGGVWRRDFTGGTVLVNPDPSATVSVPLGGTFTDAGGASVTSVTLGPASGSILFGAPIGVPTTTATTTTAATTTAPVATATTTTATATNATTTNATTTTSTTTTAPPPVAPPTPAPLTTFGTTTAGAGWTQGQPADTKYVNAVTLSAPGKLTAIHAYLSGAGGVNTEAVRGVVYADAKGAPGALRGSTSTVWVSATAKAGWVDIAFSSPLQLLAGQYWLGLQFGGWTQLVRVGYTATLVGDGRYNADAWQDGPSNAFGTVANDHERWSVYATVVANAGSKRTLLDTVKSHARAKVALKKHRAATAKKHRAHAKKKLRAKLHAARTRR